MFTQAWKAWISWPTWKKALFFFLLTATLWAHYQFVCPTPFCLHAWGQ
jgi:hypothetical protein